MHNTYTKLMMGQDLSQDVDAAFYENLEQAQPKRKTHPLVRAAIVAACICLMIPVTAWAAKSIFGVVKITIGEGKDFEGKDAVVMHRDVENVEHIPLEDFSPYLQELKETEWLYFDSWEDAEEKIGVDFLNNTILDDENTQPYTRKKKYKYDERGLAYAALKTKATPYRGVYYAADEQFFSASFSAEYYRQRIRFMITTYMTADHPLMTEEIFLVYHGFGERYYKENVNITIEEYVTKNGIPATIYYKDSDSPFGLIHPYAYFSVNNISYHIEFTQFDSQQGETGAQTKERLLALMREILDGFVIE